MRQCPFGRYDAWGIDGTMIHDPSQTQARCATIVGRELPSAKRPVTGQHDRVDTTRLKKRPIISKRWEEWIDREQRLMAKSEENRGVEFVPACNRASAYSPRSERRWKTISIWRSRKFQQNAPRHFHLPITGLFFSRFPRPRPIGILRPLVRSLACLLSHPMSHLIRPTAQTIQTSQPSRY